MINKKYDATSINSFSLQMFSSDVNIIQTDQNQIVIDTNAIEDEDYEIITSERSIEIKQKRRGFSSFNFFNSTKDFTIYLPYSLSISISIASGDLSIHRDKNKESGPDNTKVTPSLDIKLTSGDFELRKVICSTLLLSSTSSDISIENCSFSKVKFKVISSDIDIDQTNLKEIEIQSISGDVSMELLSFNKIIADLKSGDVNIRCPKMEVQGKLKTLSGDIDVNGVKFSQDSSLPLINISTLSGDIDIDGKFAEPLNVIIPENDEVIKSKFENSIKKEDKEKFLQLMLSKKIEEKDATELLKSYGFSEEEIDEIYEEYLFRKMNMEEENG